VFASGSRDHSVRLWNAADGACLAIFAGHRAHQQPVLSVAFDMSGSRLATTGIDQSVCVWNVHAALQRHEESGAHRPLMVPVPDFATQRLHENYIDSVHFVADALLTKSTDREALLWDAVPRPDHRADGAVRVLRRYDTSPQQIAQEKHNAPLWWVKSATAGLVFACGTRAGHLMLWPLVDDDEEKAGTTCAVAPSVILPPPEGVGSSAVRVVAGDARGRYWICGNDEGHVWLFIDDDLVAS
jgi:WD40 repeat protein